MNFARSFLWSVRLYGRTDERQITARYYFSFGLKEGLRRALVNLSIAIGMICAKRMHIGMLFRIKGRQGLKAILAKARELELGE